MQDFVYCQYANFSDVCVNFYYEVSCSSSLELHSVSPLCSPLLVLTLLSFWKSKANGSSVLVY